MKRKEKKPCNILDKYDRVYIDIPQCPWLHSIVVVPLKAIYYNTAADEGANIDYLLHTIEQFENMLIRYGIEA